MSESNNQWHKPITCIADAIEFATNQNERSWFRGHADKDWQLVPTVFRETSPGSGKYYDEAKLLSEFVRRHPQAKEKHANTFELLTYAQHYGLPTRLLDWTENLLVALYFATLPVQGEVDGKLILMDTKTIDIEMYFFAGDLMPEILETQALLCRPERSTYYSNGEGHCNEVNYLIVQNIIKKINEKYLNDPFRHIEVDEIIVEKNNDESEYFNLTQQLGCSIDLEIFDVFTIPNLASIKKRLSESFLRYNPPVLNHRLLLQKGCFTIHSGKIIENIEHLKINRDLENIYSAFRHAIIPHDEKAKIRDELKICGIDQSTLFPELEYQTADIKNHCMSEGFSVDRP